MALTPEDLRRSRQAALSPVTLLNPGRISPWWSVALSACLVAADYALGPYVQFPSTYVAPVCLAAWYSGLVPALALAVSLPLARLCMMLTVWDQPWDATAIAATAVLRVCVFTLMAVLLARLSAHERALRKDVRMLESLLPICMYCKSIRSDEDRWENLEAYISRKSDAHFAHGMCPTCAKRHLPEHYA